MLINLHVLYTTRLDPALVTAFERVGERGVIPGLPSTPTALLGAAMSNGNGVGCAPAGLIRYSDAISAQLLPENVGSAPEVCFYWHALVDWGHLLLRGGGADRAGGDAKEPGSAFLRGLLSHPPLHIPGKEETDPLHPGAVLVTSTYHPVPLVEAFSPAQSAVVDCDGLRSSVLALEHTHTDSLQVRKVSFPTLWDAPPLSYTSNGMVINATQPHTDLYAMLDRCLSNLAALQ